MEPLHARDARPLTFHEVFLDGADVTGVDVALLAQRSFP